MSWFRPGWMTATVAARSGSAAPSSRRGPGFADRVPCYHQRPTVRQLETLMHRHTYLAFALALVLPAPAHADICGDYRQAIDSYITASDAGSAIAEALEAAKSGIRAARASRNAVRALTKEPTLEIIDVADAIGALEAADAASTAAAEAFETLYSSITEASDEIAEATTMELEEARIAADKAAIGALDSLSKFKAMTRKTALKAASTAASTSPGATTSKALITAHESIFGAACEWRFTQHLDLRTDAPRTRHEGRGRGDHGKTPCCTLRPRAPTRPSDAGTSARRAYVFLPSRHLLHTMVRCPRNRDDSNAQP